MLWILCYSFVFAFVIDAVLVKILKLLISELGYLDESILDEEEYSEDDDAAEQDPEAQANAKTQAQKSFRVSDLCYGDDDDDLDDNLLKELESDPMFQGDIKEKLREFLRNFMQADQSSDFVQYLNENEQNMLRHLQTP